MWKKPLALFIRAWGQRNLNEFYNLTVAFETEVSVQAALEITQETERALGRRNKTSNREYANRAIDIDILYYESSFSENSFILTMNSSTDSFF